MGRPNYSFAKRKKELDKKKKKEEKRQKKIARNSEEPQAEQTPATDDQGAPTDNIE